MAHPPLTREPHREQTTAPLAHFARKIEGRLFSRRSPALRYVSPPLVTNDLPETPPPAPSPRSKVTDDKPAPPPVRSPLAELGIGAAWLIGLTAVCQMVVIVLHSNPLAVTVIQAVIVDLAVGRAGVRWDPEADDKTAAETRNATRGIGLGLGVAFAVTALVLGVSAALGWATIGVHAPTMSLALGTIRAVAIGVKDAQLYAALPLYFIARAAGIGPGSKPSIASKRFRIPVISAVVFGALAGGSSIALLPAATPANVALAASVIGATAAFWYRDRAGWAAAGVCGGFAFFAGTLLRGGLVDVGWKRGALAPGVVADGAPAWIAAALFVAVMVGVLRFRRSPPTAVAPTVLT